MSLNLSEMTTATVPCWLKAAKLQSCSKILLNSAKSQSCCDRDGPYIFTKFHGVDNFVESQPLADPNGEITGITLKFVAAGEIF